MSIKELKIEGLSHEYEVTVAASVIAESINKKLSEIQQKAKIDGFRPGKAPMNIIEKQYKQNVIGEVLDDAVNKATVELLKSKELRPVTAPAAELVSFDDGQDLIFTSKFEIFPEVPEVSIDGIELEKPVVTVDDSQIDAVLQQYADANPNFKPVKNRKTTKDGDIVKIDFEGFTDGEAFAGGKGEGHNLELGSNSFIPGFEEQLVGQKTGEEVEVNVTFPKEYHSEALAGKEALFKVKLHEILKQEKAEINDELAKKAGKENLDELKELVKGNLTTQHANVARNVVKKNLFDALSEKVTLELPTGMVEAEKESIKKQLEQAEDDKTTDAELLDLANRRVKLGIFLSDFSSKNNIEVSQEEISQAVFNEARNYPGQEQQVFEYFQKNPKATESLRGPILEEKAVDLILEKITLKDKEMSLEEVEKLLEEAQAA